jgi:hypothetical protein
VDSESLLRLLQAGCPHGHDTKHATLVGRGSSNHEGFLLLHLPVSRRLLPLTRVSESCICFIYVCTIYVCIWLCIWCIWLWIVYLVYLSEKSCVSVYLPSRVSTLHVMSDKHLVTNDPLPSNLPRPHNCQHSLSLRHPRPRFSLGKQLTRWTRTPVRSL